MPDALGGQKRVPGPLERELQTAVSHYVGSGNKTQSSARAGRARAVAEPPLQPPVVAFPFLLLIINSVCDV